jgi:hypothetical protein
LTQGNGSRDSGEPTKGGHGEKPDGRSPVSAP